MSREAAAVKPPIIGHTTSGLAFADYVDHFLARWRFNRNGHRVKPGLYALGRPNADSPVFVSANYTLSFDALRRDLKGIDGYILVLDTKGINVWCAAGKGTFGTDELVSRLQSTGLADWVNHRKIIIPQLGAPGIAAHEVKRRSGFRVIYGPVRSVDLPAFLKAGEATEDMRRVRFVTKDRLVLVPVELVGVMAPTLGAVLLLFLLAGVLPAAAAAAALLAGAVVFPVLLPWIPTPNFTTKGFVLGGIVALPFALGASAGAAGPLWFRCLLAVPYLLMMSSTTAFLALNFTGATTFTSRSGVRREIFSYAPAIAWMFGSGLIAAIALAVIAKVGALP